MCFITTLRYKFASYLIITSIIYIRDWIAGIISAAAVVATTCDESVPRDAILCVVISDSAVPSLPPLPEISRFRLFRFSTCGATRGPPANSGDTEGWRTSKDAYISRNPRTAHGVTLSHHYRSRHRLRILYDGQPPLNDSRVTGLSYDSAFRSLSERSIRSITRRSIIRIIRWNIVVS